ncbi:MAG: hypothetical protein QXH47_00465, partial [Candidatus Bathyarchaeia archaeon]
HLYSPLILIRRLLLFRMSFFLVVNIPSNISVKLRLSTLVVWICLEPLFQLLHVQALQWLSLYGLFLT